jgi:hypothetical protein
MGRMRKACPTNPSSRRRRHLAPGHPGQFLIFRISLDVPVETGILRFGPVPSEGRFAIVTDAGRDAVDAGGAKDEGACRGRRSRVVLTPRRRRQACETIRRRR